MPLAPQPAHNRNHRPEIDGLRALAVLWVVVYHASPGRMPGGYIGVDVFFVISGYLISGILFRALRNGTFSLADFYFRRCRRILPALTVVILTTWLAGYYTMDSNDFSLLGKHVAGSSLFVSNILLWSEAGYFDLSSELKPLLHFWSLGVEEQFYLIWPLMLMALFAAGRRWATAVAIGVLFVASFVINVAGLKDYPSATFYLLPSRFWELLCGAAVSYFEFCRPGQQIGAFLVGSSAASDAPVAAGRPASRISAEITGFLGLGLILAATIAIDPLTPFPGWYAVLPVFGSAMLIHAGLGSWINRRVFSLKPLVLIGLISYPLYLWHWPLLSFMRILYGDDSRLLKYALVLLAFLLAYLTWQWIEKPVQKLAAGLGRDRRKESRALAGSALVIVLLLLGGWTTMSQEGFPARFHEDANLRKFQYDPTADYREGTCFLRYTQTAAEFQPECLPLPAAAVPAPTVVASAWAVTRGATDATEAVDAGGRPPSATGLQPQIVLWGDSHAAHLALGLREFAPQVGARFAQITASACPPLENLHRSNRPYCPGIVEFALQQIRAAQPAVVVVSGAWYGVDPAVLSRELPHTVALLKQAGVAHVIVVGPFPDWKPSLPRALASYFREHQQLPERMSSGLQPTLQGLDTAIGGYVKGMPVTYVSPKDNLCDQNGCLTGIEPGRFSLVVSDNSHLTDVGSRLFVAKALSRLLRDTLADP